MKDLSLNSTQDKKRIRGKSAKVLFVLLFSIFHCLFSIRANARIYIQVDQPSEKKFPIAILEPTSKDGKRYKQWEEIAEIVRNDLRLTGLFELVPEDQFPKSKGALSPNPSEIEFPPWTLIGVQAIVNGSYETSKKETTIQLYLYDPFLGQPLLRNRYTAKKEDATTIAHHFADDIMRELTGERGVFSTQIAFVQAGKKRVKEIAVMDMDGRNVKTLTNDKTFNISPAWSPDGSQIAYTTFTENKNSEVALVPSKGGLPKRITSNGAVNVSPTWTPGGFLTIASTAGGEDTDLYLLSPNGSLIRKLAPSYGIDVNPDWSPDGSEFVFASERGGRLHLYKADSSGGNVTRLTFVGTQNDNPVWSPLGDKIVFQSLSGGWNLFIMNSDGSTIQRLTSMGCESPSWAPNGRFIATSCHGQIYIMREDGSHMTPVGPGGAYQPAWGPRK